MKPAARFLAGAIAATHVSSLTLLGAMGVSFSANAVVQDIRVVNAAGDPLPGQTVSITFPDGTVEEVEDDDDDGIIYFDFPDDGIYLVTWEGGTTTVEISGGSMTPANNAGLIVGGLLGLGLVLLGASDGDSSRTAPPASEEPPGEDPVAEDPPEEDPPSEDPPDEDPPSEDPPEEDPPVEDPPSEDPPEEDPPSEDPPDEEPPPEDPPGGGGDEVPSDDGTYSATTPTVLVTANEDEHPKSGIENASYEIIIDGTQITIIMTNSADSVSATLIGTYNPDTGEFFAVEDSGEFFGFPGTEFEMDGTITIDEDTGEWSGSARIGENGSLPDSNDDGTNQGIEVEFEGDVSGV